MPIYSDFPQAWWIITILFYGLYLVLLITRKSYKKAREVRNQFLFAFFVLVLAILVENIGVKTDLWTYLPGNWPLILWVNYFGSGLLGYQILKKIEDK